METLNEKEQFLMRKGSLLNMLGLLKCAHANNNCITKEHYTYLIEVNFNSFPLRDDLKKRVDKVWKEATNMFPIIGLGFISEGMFILTLR